jgi:putative hydrolase
MIEVDFHVHTLFSLCGLHTVLELLDRARTLGMKGFAVTDHGQTVGGRLTSVFFERFTSPYPEVAVFKGIECNLLDADGTIDFPLKFLKWIDIALLGIHPNTRKGASREAYTAMLIRAIEKNPFLDIITHPNDPNYPVDYDVLARCAAERSVALECNNSKVLYGRSTVDEVRKLLAACVKHGCSIAVSSDTHAIHELGDDANVRPILNGVAFPEELIINRDAENAFEYIRLSHKRKKAIVSSQIK